MTNITFLPWVGNDYSKAYYGKRVMVLGESHYCAVEDVRLTMTTDVLRTVFDPAAEFEGYMNTFTKFARALDGTDVGRTEQECVWQRVMFYNYVQVPMTYARVSPTTAQFRSSDDAFFTILEQYRPEKIIVWGSRLYNNLPRLGEQGPDVKGCETWIYRLKDGTPVHLLPVTHPSASFSPTEWHEVISKFLKCPSIC